MNDLRAIFLEIKYSKHKHNTMPLHNKVLLTVDMRTRNLEYQVDTVSNAKDQSIPIRIIIPLLHLASIDFRRTLYNNAGEFAGESL